VRIAIEAKRAQLEKRRMLTRNLLTMVAQIMKRMVRERSVQDNSPEIQKIAMIRECCIGDVLQTTPAIRAVRLPFRKPRSIIMLLLVQICYHRKSHD